MFRKYNPIMVLLIISSTLLGCTQHNDILSVASFKWPGYESLFLAQREGWLQADGIAIVEKSSATEAMKALETGEVVAATLTLDEVLRARERGIPLQVVMVFDESAGGDAVLTRESLNDVAQLKGLRIGVESSALGALVLLKTLEIAQLAASEVDVVDIPVGQHISSWQEGELDALITFEPILTQLEHMGAHKILDSRKMPGLIVDVLVVRADKAPAYHTQLRALTAAHFRVLNNLRINPQDTAYRMAGHLGLSGNDVLSAFRNMQLPDLAINRKYLTRDGHVVDSALNLSNLMLQGQLIKQQSSLTGLVSDDYLPVEK